jgi:hypothetical protein
MGKQNQIIFPDPHCHLHPGSIPGSDHRKGALTLTLVQLPEAT